MSLSPSKELAEEFSADSLPRWITRSLITDTLRTWQPYYEFPLTAIDAVEILCAVGRLLDSTEEGNR